jgi:hypothetical protein
MEFKNLFALGLFLFGTTFLWMTAAMSGKTPPPSGTAWTVTNVLAYAAIAVFTVAAWAVFKQYSWWEAATLLAAFVGLAAVPPFVIAQIRLDVGLGDSGVQINLWLHVLASAATAAILLLPATRDWLSGRL